MTPTEELRPKMDRLQRTCLLIGGLGMIGLIIGLFTNPKVAFQSYLWAYLYWFGITFGCLGVYLLHNVVGGNWGVVIRRLLESGIRMLPLAFIAILPILFAMNSGYLYLWTDANYVKAHHLVAVKHGYLTPWFFALRLVVYFLIWFLWGFRLLRMSGEQDRTGDRDQTIAGRMKRFSAPGLVLFVFTICWAFIDWIMSLEPDWYSTMYPWLSMIGQVLLTLSFVIAVLIFLSKRKPFAGVLNFQHYNDLGNLMLCFTMLWAYMSFGQFLIIWAENLPDEIPWYLKRFSFGWGYLAVFVAIFHFCVPFILLLMRFVKRNPKLLFWVAVWMIGIRLVDLFWVVIPAFRQPNLSFQWTDLVAAVGMGGIWLGVFLYYLKSRPLLPMHDPRIALQILESQA